MRVCMPDCIQCVCVCVCMHSSVSTSYPIETPKFYMCKMCEIKHSIEGKMSYDNKLCERLKLCKCGLLAIMPTPGLSPSTSPIRPIPAPSIDTPLFLSSSSSPLPEPHHDFGNGVDGGVYIVAFMYHTYQTHTLYVRFGCTTMRKVSVDIKNCLLKKKRNNNLI